MIRIATKVYNAGGLETNTFNLNQPVTLKRIIVFNGNSSLIGFQINDKEIKPTMVAPVTDDHQQASEYNPIFYLDADFYGFDVDISLNEGYTISHHASSASNIVFNLEVEPIGEGEISSTLERDLAAELSQVSDEEENIAAGEWGDQVRLRGLRQLGVEN